MMKLKFPNMKTKTSLLVTMALSLGLALAAGVASTSSANATGYYYGGGYSGQYSGHNSRQRHGKRHYRGHKRNSYKNHGYKNKRHYRGHSCGPQRAVNTAWNLGLYQAQVHRVKQNRIVVSGYQRSYYGPVRAKMVFDRWSNCRLIKTVSYR